MDHPMNGIALPEFGIFSFSENYLRGLSFAELLEVARIVDRLHLDLVEHFAPESVEAIGRAMRTLQDIGAIAYETAAESPLEAALVLEIKRIVAPIYESKFDPEEAVEFATSGESAPPLEEIAEGIDPAFFSPLAAALLAIVTRSPGVRFDAAVIELQRLNLGGEFEEEHDLAKLINAAKHGFWAMSCGRLIQASTRDAHGQQFIAWNSKLSVRGLTR